MWDENLFLQSEYFWAQKLRMHRIVPPKILIWNAIFTFVAFFFKNGQKAVCTWNDLRLISLYLLQMWMMTDRLYNPKSEKVGTVWKMQIKKESSDF